MNTFEFIWSLVTLKVKTLHRIYVTIDTWIGNNLNMIESPCICQIHGLPKNEQKHIISGSNERKWERALFQTDDDRGP